MFVSDTIQCVYTLGVLDRTVLQDPPPSPSPKKNPFIMSTAASPRVSLLVESLLRSNNAKDRGAVLRALALLPLPEVVRARRVCRDMRQFVSGAAYKALLAARDAYNEAVTERNKSDVTFGKACQRLISAELAYDCVGGGPLFLENTHPPILGTYSYFDREASLEEVHAAIRTRDEADRVYVVTTAAAAAAKDALDHSTARFFYYLSVALPPPPHYRGLVEHQTRL